MLAHRFDTLSKPVNPMLPKFRLCSILGLQTYY